MPCWIHSIRVSARRLQHCSEGRRDVCDHVPDSVPHGRKCGAGVCAGREMDSQREEEREGGGRQWGGGGGAVEESRRGRRRDNAGENKENGLQRRGGGGGGGAVQGRKMGRKEENKQGQEWKRGS